MRELDKIISFEDFTDWSLCQWGIIDLYLPTECVVTEPKIVMPQIARAFRTDLYLYENEIVDYNTLRNKVGIDKFKGSGYYESVILLEVWEDSGDDGHTGFTLKGFVFVKESNLKESLKTKKYPEDLINDLIWKDYDLKKGK